jgi:Putative zinc-finger
MIKCECATPGEIPAAALSADLAPSCKAAARLMSESRDRQLTPQERRCLNAHLTDCGNCIRLNKQLDLLTEVARRYATIAIAEKK